MPKLEFWFDFASTYSYLSAMRIEAAGKVAGIEIVWRPFLLGPIFKAQGWETSPFNLYPAKGRYMIRDIERIAERRGLVFHMPEVFPANGLLAARAALAIDDPAAVAAFSCGVFQAQFGAGLPISDETVIRRCLAGLNIDVDGIFSEARSDDVKQRLRRQSDRAIELGLFGAPSFVCGDGEIFWGDDRLEMALDWAAT